MSTEQPQTVAAPEAPPAEPAPVAPAPAPAAPPPAAPPTEAPALPDLPDASQFARDMRLQDRAAAIGQPRPQPRDPDTGRFVSPEGEAAPQDPAEQPEPSQAEPPPEGRAPDQATVPASEDGTEEAQAAKGEPAETGAPESPDGLVQVPVPEGDPLREQGVEALQVPAETERHIRALLNRESYRTEAGQLRSEVDQALRHGQAKAVEAQYWQQQVLSGLGSDIAARFKEIQRAWGPEEARKYLDGEKARLTLQARQHSAKMQPQIEGQLRQRQLERFANYVGQQRESHFPLWTDADLGEAFVQWGTHCQLRGLATEQMDYGRFREFASGLYQANPQVREQLQQGLAAEATRRAEEEARRREGEAQRRASKAQAESPLSGAPPTPQTRAGPEPGALPDAAEVGRMMKRMRRPRPVAG